MLMAVFEGRALERRPQSPTEVAARPPRSSKEDDIGFFPGGFGRIINMTNVVLAPARFLPHIQMVLSPPLVYLVSYLVSSVSRLSSLVSVSRLFSGVVSGLVCGLALLSRLLSAVASHLI